MWDVKRRDDLSNAINELSFTLTMWDVKPEYGSDIIFPRWVLP